MRRICAFCGNNKEVVQQIIFDRETAPGDAFACPDCGSPEPRLHPAVSGGGEVTRVCQHPFHDGKSALDWIDKGSDRRMKVSQVIAALAHLDQDAIVHIWGENENHETELHPVERIYVTGHSVVTIA